MATWSCMPWFFCCDTLLCDNARHSFDKFASFQFVWYHEEIHYDQSGQGKDNGLYVYPIKVLQGGNNSSDESLRNVVSFMLAIVWMKLMTFFVNRKREMSSIAISRRNSRRTDREARVDTESSTDCGCGPRKKTSIIPVLGVSLRYSCQRSVLNRVRHYVSSFTLVVLIVQVFHLFLKLLPRLSGSTLQKLR